MIGVLVGLASLCLIMMMWSLCRVAQGSWIGPGGVACGVWFFGTLIPLLISHSFPVAGPAYVLVTVFIMVIAAASSLPIVAFRSPAARGAFTWTDAQITWLSRVYWLSLAIGFASPLILLWIVINQFGAAELLILAGNVTEARYSGEFDQPLIVSILNAFLYFAALLAGLRTGSHRTKRLQSIGYLLWVVPLMTITLVMTTKASIIFGAGFWGAGRLAGIALRGAAGSVSLARLMPILILVSGVGFTFAVVNQLVRWGSFDADQIEESVTRSTGTFAGHMSVFEHWLNDGGANRPAYSAGGYTFAGIAETLGLKQRTMGLYEEAVVFEDGNSSNIYTAFRSLIEDFGLVGAFVFMASLGFLGGICWVRLLQGSLAAAAIYAVYAVYVFLSPLTSVFVYNTNVVALVLFLLFVGVLGAVGRMRPREARVATV